MFHFKPSDVFEQGLEELDWTDYRTDQTWEGSWNYHVPKGHYYAVRVVLAWLPQPSYPSLATTSVFAHQDALAVDPGWEVCKM
jgi:hypothetical protein